VLCVNGVFVYAADSRL